MLSLSAMDNENHRQLTRKGHSMSSPVSKQDVLITTGIFHCNTRLCTTISYHSNKICLRVKLIWCRSNLNVLNE
jgi:hypothetical protein